MTPVNEMAEIIIRASAAVDNLMATINDVAEANPVLLDVQEVECPLCDHYTNLITGTDILLVHQDTQWAYGTRCPASERTLAWARDERPKLETEIDQLRMRAHP